MHKKFLLLVLGLYLVSTLGSFVAFSYFSSATPLGSGTVKTSEGEGDDQTLLGSLLTIAPSEPRDQECPLNGKLYTQQEREAWEKHRPLAVMIENSPDARPQSGMSQADVVFEAIAEGGVTRFMGMFYCDVQANDTTLAPVRSARSYFVDYASGFNLPMYVHAGGANLDGPADALGQISDYGWNLQNDVSTMSVGLPVFYRNEARLKEYGKQSVATEHSQITSTERLWTEADKRGWTNMSPERKLGRKVVEAEEWSDGFEPWTFSDESTSANDATKVSYEFWTGYNQYAVEWQYDAATKMYKRIMAGEPHIDLNTGEQIMAANVVVLLTTEKGPIDELKHMLYTTTGTGKVLIFQNGGAITAKWDKKTRESELRFTNAAGKDIPMARGMTWISVVDTTTDVTY